MTKNLLSMPLQAKLHTLLHNSLPKILLLIFCFCAIQAFAQPERLLKKQVFVDDPHEAIESITLPNKKTIFGAYDENINTSFETASSLWITDGTKAGTKMLKYFLNEPGTDFLTNITHSTNFFYFNNKVFLNAGNHIDESINFLYVTDGTEKGTFRLIDNAVGKSVYAVYNAKLYISNNTELLTIDGTKAGTRKIPIPALSGIKNLFVVNQYLIIETEEHIYSYNDQSEAFALLSIKTGAAVATNEYVFFAGIDGDLRKTNGAIGGTTSVINIAAGADIISPSALIADSRYIIFEAYADKSKNSTCLWLSDGHGTNPLKDNKGRVVSTDTTGFKPIRTKFEEKMYFYLTNLDQNTLASNNYLFVFSNASVPLSARFLKNMTGFDGNLFPFTPKVNTKEEYFYGKPENPAWLEGDYTIKGFTADKDSLINLMVIETERSTSWIKGGDKVYYNKERYGANPGLYVKGLCDLDVKINTPDGTNICNGKGVRFSVSVTKAGKPLNDYTLKWSSESFTPVQESGVISYPGTYTALVSDNTGCSVSTSVILTKSDSLSVSIKGDNSICPGQGTTLTATALDGTAPYTYQWKNGLNTTGTNTNTINANTAANYSVIVKDSKGCQGTSPAYAVTLKPTPDVRITRNGTTDIVSGGSVILSVAQAPNQTYQWFKNSTAISNAKSNSLTVIEAGQYSVTVNANGCSANSEIITINLILANESINESVLIQVFPNPTDNLIKLNIMEPLKKAVQISLVNANGVIVKKWETRQTENTLSLSDLPAGQYILNVDINKQSITKKIIKL